jgi:hypothetical protein
LFKQVSHNSFVFFKAVNEAELTVSLPDKAPLIARSSSGNVWLCWHACKNKCCPTKIYMLKSPLQTFVEDISHENCQWAYFSRAETHIAMPRHLL